MAEIISNNKEQIHTEMFISNTEILLIFLYVYKWFQDNSEEMYSLDNDSFLNSLEAMTIQNYWTDTVKHTKL